MLWSLRWCRKTSRKSPWPRPATTCGKSLRATRRKIEGDFPFFEAAAQRELVAAAEAATDGELRRAIEALRDGLDLADAPGFAVVYHLFYVGVLLQMLAEGNIRVPRRGGPPVPVSVFSLRSEHLADYAAYLEEQGERAAAARVREVAPLFDKDVSDADPSDW
ncbi:MAG: hypothetical protein ACUVRC_09685 [Desulfotomaculales bacterium]